MNSLRKKLVNTLDVLPLHSLTLTRLEKNILDRNTDINKLILISGYVQEYSNSNGKIRVEYRALESLIRRIYFHWDNTYEIQHRNMRFSSPLPPHLRLFHTQYESLLHHWPREYHYDLKEYDRRKKCRENGEGDKVISLRDGWTNRKPNIIDLCLLTQDKESAMTSEVENGLRMILRQYQFLYENIKVLYGNKKLALPLIEIPLTVMGESIASRRVTNMVKNKINTVGKILIHDYPAIYNPSCITELKYITSSASGDNTYTLKGKRTLARTAADHRHYTKAIQRLYQRILSSAYHFVDGDERFRTLQHPIG